MAETLVLANLVINADGTITATNRAGQAITTLEKQTTTSVRKIEGGFGQVGLSAKRLADGFLNVRRLVSGLFAGFSVGGIVFALGSLIQSTIASTQAFKDFKASFLDAMNALIINESTVDRFARKLKEFGVTTATDLSQKIKDLRTELRLAEQDLAAGTKTTGLGLVAESLALWSGIDIGRQTTKLTANEMAILTKNIAEGNKRLAEMTEQFNKMGAAAKKEIPAAVDTGGPRTVSDLIFGPSKFGETAAGDEFGRPPGLTAALAGAQESAASLHNEFVAGIIGMDQYESSLQKVIDKVVELGATQNDLDLLLEDFATDKANEASLAVIRLSDAYALLGMGLQGFAVGLVEIASGTETSSRKIVAAVLKAVGMEAAARGAFYVLEGIARGFSSYGFDATAYGLIATGTKMIALGAALGFAAGKVAGNERGGGGSRGSRESAAPAEATAQARPQELHIYLDGVRGFIGTREEIGRALAELLGEAALDGVRA